MGVRKRAAPTKVTRSSGERCRQFAVFDLTQRSNATSYAFGKVLAPRIRALHCLRNHSPNVCIAPSSHKICNTYCNTEVSPPARTSDV